LIAIVRALTGLGHGLGLVITAEGIEQSDQHAALLKEGCERGEGFLFSRAIPAHETQRFPNQTNPQNPASVVEPARSQVRKRL
jgi:EAL domain-containing protein (putative c-di-GMP-specific phosphodiesterase class I)